MVIRALFARLERIGGVLDEIDENLVELPLAADDLHAFGQVEADFGRIAQGLDHPVGRRVHQPHQIEAFQRLALVGRKAAQVLHDIAHPLGPFERAVDERADVGEHPVDFQPIAQGRDFRRTAPASIAERYSVIAAP
jgi:hypothetical protein